MSDLASTVITTFVERTVTLATAESLTGGLLGAALTAVPGASAAYLGGAVAYASRLKTDLLGVPAATIEQYTVVSEEVALAMAVGLQERTEADWVVAVTGVAGPTAQEGHDPGEVYVCVAGPRIPSLPPQRLVERYTFEGDRDAVRAQTVDAALGMLLRVVAPV